MAKHSTTFRSVSLLGVLGAGALLAWGAGPGDWFGGEAETAVRGAPVRRGPLRISVIERGSLSAANSVVLKSEIEGQTTILFLIEEGKRVEPGDLLVELDATSQIERRVSQEITVKNAEADYVKAKQQYEIQASQNESDIAAAESRLDFARTDLLKYINGDWPQQVKDAETEILLAQEELERARDRLDWSQRLEGKGFITRSELQEDTLAYSRSQVQLDQAKARLELLRTYDYPREKKRLEADVAESERELERVRLQADARIVDFLAAMETNQAKLELEREQLAKIVNQIDKAKIYAPTSGMVVYAQEGGGRFGRDDEIIQEGTSVRERQEIITIPSTQGMIAEASLHESVIEKVEEGQRVLVKVDALGDRTFNGLVKFKAVLPDKNSWWANPDLRVYRTQIEVLDPVPEMRPGMNCSLEVLVQDIQAALYVPLQSVFLDAGKTVCFVDTGGTFERRDVEVGQSNTKWVEILSGLEEGEIVLLSRPPGVQLRPTEGDDLPPEWRSDDLRGPLAEGAREGGVGPDAGAPADRMRGERPNFGGEDGDRGDRGGERRNREGGREGGWPGGERTSDERPSAIPRDGGSAQAPGEGGRSEQ